MVVFGFIVGWYCVFVDLYISICWLVVGLCGCIVLNLVWVGLLCVLFVFGLVLCWLCCFCVWFVNLYVGYFDE